MMVKATGKEAAPIEALQEKAYQKIKCRIVDCRSLPGAVISRELLSREFGTSRTPIREALLRLQRENLVTIYPRRGTFVSQISLKDIHEVYQVRLIIEPRVARMTCYLLGTPELERHKNLFAGMRGSRATTIRGSGSTGNSTTTSSGAATTAISSSSTHPSWTRTRGCGSSRGSFP